MKYAFTIYGDESQRESRERGAAGADDPGLRRCSPRRWRRRECWSPARASTRPRRRRPCACATASTSVTDGPFAETKEQLGGFYVLDVQGPRRGDRVGGEDPGRPVRLDRDPPGDGLRRGREPRRGSDRPVELEASPELVDRLFRHESGRAIASLIRVLGDFDLAEDAVQEAFVVAMQVWPERGIPDNPGRLDHHHRAEQGDRPAAARAPRHREARGAAGARASDPTEDDEPEEPPRDPRRPPAADLHLLPPGAGARGPGRAHAANAGRPLDTGDRAGVPGQRADDGPAPRPGQAQDQDGEDPLRGAGGPRPARPAAIRSRLALPDLQRGLLWPPPTRPWSGESSPARRSAWPGRWPG